jgi:hypothetical protein
MPGERAKRVSVSVSVSASVSASVVVAAAAGVRTLKLERLDKLDQLPVVLLPLAREPRYERRPQGESRDAVPKLVQQFHGVVLGRTVHGEERQVGNVLEGHVDVLCHLGVGGNLVDEIVGEVRRVGVEDADPVPGERANAVRE